MRVRKHQEVRCQWRKIAKQASRVIPVGVLCLGVVVLTACSDVAPYHNDNVAAIHQQLQRSAIDNQQIANANAISSGKNTAISAIVNQALSPSVKHSPALAHQEKINVSVSDVEIKPFLLHLVKGTDYSMAVANDVTGEITIQESNATMAQVLQSLRKTYGYEYFIDGRSIEVFMPRLETKVFMVNHLDVDRSGSSDLSVNSSAHGVSSNSSDSSNIAVSTSTSDNFWENIDNTIAMLVENDTKAEGTPSYTVNRDTGVVVVRADQMALREVEQFLAATQSVESRQVLIEASILEVQLNKEFDSGIDWDMAGAMFSSSSLANTSGGSPLVPTGYSNVFTLNESKGKFSVAIDMLSKEGKVSVLSNPRVSTINNQKAIIKVGSDKYYVTSLSTTDLVNTDTAIQSNISLESFFSGLALEVIPQIDKHNNVTMHIHPAISLTTGDETKMQIGDAHTSLPTASTSVRETDSVVKAKSGQVVIIGGLMETMTDVRRSGLAPLTQTKVPKVVKGATTTKLDGLVKTELVILLKPIVANNQTWANQVGDLSKKHFNQQEFGAVNNYN